MSQLRLISVAIVLLTSVFAMADKPRVAIMPILHVSGEKWEALKANQIKKSNEYLETEFAKRGMEVVPAEAVKAVLLDKKIDFEDEENQKRATLFEVGKALKADYIILAVITGTDQKKQKRVFYEDTEGQTTVKLWLLDCKGDVPIISAKSFTGRSGGNRLSFDHKGSDRQIQAAANALRDGLKSFFDTHPVVK